MSADDIDLRGTTIEQITPQSFNTELRVWVRAHSDKSWQQLMGVSRSAAYNKLSGSHLMTIEELLAVISKCRPQHFSQEDGDEWVRARYLVWSEKWNSALEYLLAQQQTQQQADGPHARNGEAVRSAPTRSSDDHPEQAFERMGLVRAFIPGSNESGVAPTSTNARRNARKLEVLQSAKETGGTVRLLAETGNSYLHVRGPFNTAISLLLEGGGALQVVLMDPGEHLRGDLDELRMKFRQSMRGFQELERNYPDQIDLKVLRARLTATILMTSESAFFEPYLHVKDDDRERLLLNTFELEFDHESRMYATLAGTFDLHYEQADIPTRWLRA